MYIDNLVNIRAKDVHAAYKTAAVSAAKAVAVLDFAKLKTKAELQPKVEGGTTYRVRLILNMGLDPERVSAEVNDYYLNHTKEFIFEVEGTTAEMAEALLEQIKRNATMNSDEMFTAVAAGDAVTLTARDEYVRFKSVDVVDLYQDVDAGERITGNWETKRYEFKSVADTKSTDPAYHTTDGTVGVGTTNYIINNVRLQTIENVNPYNGADTDERPLPRALYDQYTVELVTERRHIAGSVVGSINTSLTTMVFFVLHNESDCGGDPSADFEAALSTVATILPEETTSLPSQVISYVDDTAEHADSDSASIPSV